MITLNNEDCLETLKRIEDNTIDLCLTDLPYGILSNKKEVDYYNENRNFVGSEISKVWFDVAQQRINDI